MYRPHSVFLVVLFIFVLLTNIGEYSPCKIKETDKNTSQIYDNILIRPIPSATNKNVAMICVMVMPCVYLCTSDNLNFIRSVISDRYLVKFLRTSSTKIGIRYETPNFELT